MNKTSRLLAGAVVLVLGLAGLAALALVTQDAHGVNFCPFKGNKTELHRQAAENLAHALAAMDDASKALAAGDKDKTAAALDKAKGLVKETHTTMLQQAPGAKTP
jgi:hypothetical protein